MCWLSDRVGGVCRVSDSGEGGRFQGLLWQQGACRINNSSGAVYRVNVMVGLAHAEKAGSITCPLSASALGSPSPKHLGDMFYSLISWD